MGRRIRQGTAHIGIRNVEFESEVRVVSTWPAVLPFGHGTPGMGGITPAISASESPVVGSVFKVTVSEAVGGAKGILLVTNVPEPAPNPFAGLLFAPKGSTVGFQVGGPEGEPGKGSVDVLFPIPNDPSARGRVHFIQAVFPDGAGPGRRSTSNGLRVSIH